MCVCLSRLYSLLVIRPNHIFAHWSIEHRFRHEIKRWKGASNILSVWKIFDLLLSVYSCSILNTIWSVTSEQFLLPYSMWCSCLFFVMYLHSAHSAFYYFHLISLFTAYEIASYPQRDSVWPWRLRCTQKLAKTSKKTFKKIRARRSMKGMRIDIVENWNLKPIPKKTITMKKRYNFVSCSIIFANNRVKTSATISNV